MKECCGNCKYNKRDFSKPQGKGYSEFCCGNEDSENLPIWVSLLGILILAGYIFAVCYANYWGY